MEKTEKIYDSDSFLTEFTAVVLSCTPCPDSVFYDIILDRTLFFPEEGGQGCDTGTINGSPVLDVQIKEDTILHTMQLPLEKGTEIHGIIDWKNRFSNMQQHSGEHIVSGLVFSHFGLHNVGFHLGSQCVTLDFDGFLEKESLDLIETLANEAVFRNVAVQTEYPSPTVLDTLDYRSKKALSGPVRIVTIPGYDVCACCAPHVKHTGEIGIIKIVDAIRYKGGSRLNILCGGRALSDYREKQEQVSLVSGLLSAKPELIFDAVSRLKNEIYSMKGELNGLTCRLAEEKAAAVPEGTGSLCLFETDMTPDAHRRYSSLLAEKCSGVCAVFVGSDTDGYRYILSGNKKKAELNELLKSRLHAKGGGLDMIQGSLNAARADIEAAWERLT